MATIEKPENGSAESVVDKAKSTATEMAGVARDKLADARDKIVDKVTDKAGAQRDRAASGLGGVAQALRQTGDTLGDEAGLPPAVTDYVSKAAEGVERLGDYLNGKDLGAIVSDVERFARREPALFLGGAFVLGLMGARFLKSSARRSPNYDSSHDYARTDRAFGGYEDRYATAPYTREPRFESMEHTATPTPMAPPPRRDPTINTSGTSGTSGTRPFNSSTPVTPTGTSNGGSGTTGNK